MSFSAILTKDSKANWASAANANHFENKRTNPRRSPISGTTELRPRINSSTNSSKRIRTTVSMKWSHTNRLVDLSLGLTGADIERLWAFSLFLGNGQYCTIYRIRYQTF